MKKVICCYLDSYAEEDRSSSTAKVVRTRCAYFNLKVNGKYRAANGPAAQDHNSETANTPTPKNLPATNILSFLIKHQIAR